MPCEPEPESGRTSERRKQRRFSVLAAQATAPRSRSSGPRAHMSPTVRVGAVGTVRSVHANRLARVLAAISFDGGSDPATYPQRVCTAGVDLPRGQRSRVDPDDQERAWSSLGVGQCMPGGGGPPVHTGRGAGVGCLPLGGSGPWSRRLAHAVARWPSSLRRRLVWASGRLFSFPLQVGVIGLGALNLFRDTPGFPSDDELADALVLADVVTEDLIDLQALGELPLGPLRSPSASGLGCTRPPEWSRCRSTRTCPPPWHASSAFAFANEMTIFDVADQVTGPHSSFNYAALRVGLSQGTYQRQFGFGIVFGPPSPKGGVIWRIRTGWPRPSWSWRTRSWRTLTLSTFCIPSPYGARSCWTQPRRA